MAQPILLQLRDTAVSGGVAQLGAVNRFLLGDAVSQNLLSGRQNGVLRSAAGFDATTVAVRCLLYSQRKRIRALSKFRAQEAASSASEPVSGLATNRPES